MQTNIAFYNNALLMGMPDKSYARKGFDDIVKTVSQKTRPLISFENRFIGYLDFLGFKKIIEIQPISKLEWIYSEMYSFALANISEMKRFEYKGVPLASSDLSKVNVNMLFVSDSIILWSEDISAESFLKMIFVLWKFISQGFIYGYPLRGALVKGQLGVKYFKEDTKLNVSGQLVCGPGYLKAVKLEEKQDWSGCVIEKDCLSYYDDLTKNSKNGGVKILENIKLLTKWNVSFIDTTEEYYVINWMLPYITEERLRNSFREWGKPTDSPTVTKIINNTFEFFNKIREG